ncbi:MAG TPA: biosynthetic-type acetolactate synthase large subunit [Spirochaetota bacterium]|nr:biosynthetic-type acetolactate synthase large subunit [Spirochaetota bacterium]
MKLTGSQIIVESLRKHEIYVVTGIPGGSNLPLYSALHESGIEHVLARHEQGAGFIAQGMARCTGKPAVCLATSGPGATNLVTALADAKMDSVPIVAITGQVSLPYIGTDAFQEVDMFGLSLSITKHSFLVKKIDELAGIMRDAFYIASSGRPGPVLVDIPKDIQNQVIEIDSIPEPRPLPGHSKPDDREIIKIAEAINKSKRPVIYPGGGVVISGACAVLREFAEKTSVPVAVSLRGLSSFYHDHPLYMGLIGMHGNVSTNMVIDEADLVICIGARFNDRTTGTTSGFCPNARIIHADIDSSEIDKIRRSDMAVTCDAGVFLEMLMPHVEHTNRSSWLARIDELKKIHDAGINLPPQHPVEIIRTISRCAPKDSLVATDVGQHQMWVARTYPFTVGRTFLTSGGLGTMGFGLPAAIGAALADRSKTVICFSGDGSILMNIQELATLADLDLNVKVIILNNGQLGLVRQQQELFYDKKYIASSFSTRPDFSLIAAGFGVKGISKASGSINEEDIKTILNEPGPCLVNIDITGEYNVYPMVPPGKDNIYMLTEDMHE